MITMRWITLSMLLAAALILLAACGSSTATAPAAATVTPTSPSPTTTPETPTEVSTTPVPTNPDLIVPEGLPDPELSGVIAIDGSSTVFPITELAALAFRELAPNVEISLGVSGSGGGFKKFCAGETVISDASRPIKESEAEACAENGIEFIELPVAFDGISVVTNAENDWAACMTVTELQRLWEPAAEGQVANWNQLRPDFPDAALNLYGAGADSGTYDYFTLAVVGEEGVSRQDFIGSEDDYLIAQDVAGDVGGLGFFGYAYYLEYADRLNLVQIDNGNGCVAPDSETIATGSYQPLSRPIFINVRADALDRPEVRAFVDFYLANGSQLVTQARYVPLPERAYDLAAERVERRVVGSLFAGGSQLGVSIEELLTLEEE
jgi:phosphate transport system substrate-binding protein